MNATSLIQRLHQHRRWVNQQLLDNADRLDAQQLRQEFPIGQGSVWKSLLHLYAAEFIWLEALTGNADPLAPGDLPGQLPGNQAGPDAIGSLDELAAIWSQLDQRWGVYLDQLNPEMLAELIYKVNSSGYRKRHATRCSDVLLHVCTHAQYTTAQVVNMMRHLGVEPLPDPMLISLARTESAI